MVLVDNLSRPLEAILTLACASLYAGGRWGSFRLAETLAYLLFQISLLGMDRGIIWWRGQVKPSEYDVSLSASVWMVLATSIIGMFAFLFLSQHVIGGVRGLDLPRYDRWSVAASIPLLALASLLYQANLNRKNMAARIVGNNLVVPLVMFGGAIVGHVFGTGWRLANCFLCANAANALLAIGSFFWLHGEILQRPAFPPRRLVAYGLPLAGSDLLSGVMARFDLALLGNLAGIRAVEVYNLVTTIGKTLQAIRQSFEGLLLTSFSHCGSHRVTPNLRHRFNHSVWSVGTLLGLALLVVVFWGREFLSFLDPQYRDGYPALVAIASFTCLNVAGDLGGLMLQGLGRSRAWGASQLVGFVVNIGCNLWWIPLWGTLGGIFALGASMLIQGTLCLFLLWLAAEKHLWELPVLKSLFGLAAILLFFCLFSLEFWAPWPRVTLFLGASLILGIAYRRHVRMFRQTPDHTLIPPPSEGTSL